MTSLAHSVVRRRSIVQRLTALFAVLAFCGASFGGAAHRAIVQHVACEHGQLVEMSAPVGRIAPRATSSTLSSASAHQHHHCNLDGVHAPALERSKISSVSFDPTWRVTTRSTIVAVRVSLLYAPKTSPPV